MVELLQRPARTPSGPQLERRRPSRPARRPARRIAVARRGRHAAEDPAGRSEAGADRTAATIFVMSFGVFLQAVATVVGRHGGPDSTTDNVFWLSLLLIVLPAAMRILSSTAARTEILRLAVAVPVALGISRIMLYPTRFMWHDELAHQNTLRQLGRSHHLFSANPLLPVSGYYPGLEIVTDGVQAATGLSQHTSAEIVLLGARVVLALAVIGIIEFLTRSVRIAAVASLIYVCNPQFVVFNSQYSYQTLALPLAILCIYLVMTHGRRGVVVLAPLIAASVAATHHLTSFLLTAALAVWLLLSLIFHDRTVNRAALLTTTAASLFAIGGMLSVHGNPVLLYLSQIYGNAAKQVHGLTQGEQTHVLFSDFSGDRTPPWQQAALLGSVVITCLLLLPALWQARIWVRHRISAGILMCLLAAMYPLIPLGHLTFATSEVFDRSSGFVYPGVALVLASFVVRSRSGPARWLFAGAVPTLVLTAMFVGGTILGAGPRWNRTPGPFLVSADPRSVDAYNLSAAGWLAEYAPPGSKVLSDRIGRLTVGAIGGQHPVTQLYDQVNLSGLLLDPELNPDDVRLAHEIGLRYVAVDRRMSTSLPRVGIYYENGEWGQGRTAAVPSNALTKLDGNPGVQRVYDNGAVAIYDVRHIAAR